MIANPHILLPSLVAALLCGGCVGEGAADTGSFGAEPEADLAAVAPAAADQQVALVNWAGDAPLIAVLDIVAVEAFVADAAPGLWTEARLEVVEVVQDLDGTAPAAGSRVGTVVQGGTIGEVSIISSEAPILFADDRVLARLEVDEEGLAFVGGLNSVIAMDDDALRVCLNPTPDAADRCVDEGATLLVDHQLPSFEQADLDVRIPLETVTLALR